MSLGSGTDLVRSKNPHPSGAVKGTGYAGPTWNGVLAGGNQFLEINLGWQGFWNNA